MKAAMIVLALFLAGCSGVPRDVRVINETVNATPYQAHVTTPENMHRVADDKGGNCWEKAQRKCAMARAAGHQCVVVLGCITGTGQGHAVARVDGKYWLDNRSRFYTRTDDFNPIIGGGNCERWKHANP